MSVKIPNYKERASTIFVTGLNEKYPINGYFKKLRNFN